jgi:hypothetical protein
MHEDLGWIFTDSIINKKKKLSNITLIYFGLKNILYVKLYHYIF